MLVRFTNNWFSPTGKRYRAGENEIELDDSMFDLLPSSAFVDGVRVSELRSKGKAPTPVPVKAPAKKEPPKKDEDED